MMEAIAGGIHSDPEVISLSETADAQVGIVAVVQNWVPGEGKSKDDRSVIATVASLDCVFHEGLTQREWRAGPLLSLEPGFPQ